MGPLATTLVQSITMSCRCLTRHGVQNTWIKTEENVDRIQNIHIPKKHA